MVTTGFKIDAETSTVGWTNSHFSKGVGFVWKSDGSQSVWAVFTGEMMADSVGAGLLAVFD